MGPRTSPPRQSATWTPRTGFGPIHSSQPQSLALRPCPKTHLTNPSECWKMGPAPPQSLLSFVPAPCFSPSPATCTLPPACSPCATFVPAFLFQPGREQTEARVIPVSSQRPTHPTPPISGSLLNLPSLNDSKGNQQSGPESWGAQAPSFLLVSTHRPSLHVGEETEWTWEREEAD